MKNKFFSLLLILIIVFLSILADQALLYHFQGGPVRALDDYSKTPFIYSEKHDFLVNPHQVEKLNNLAPEGQSFMANYVVNKHGMRESFSRGNKKKIVNIFGDSFTFGLFLNQGETFVDHLNKKSNLCWFRNYGVPAFSLIQMVNLAEDTEIVSPSDISLFVFIADDVFRSLRSREIRRLERRVDLERIRNDFLPTKSYLNLKIPRGLRNNSYVFGRIYELLQIRLFWNDVSFDDFYTGVSNYYKTKYPDGNSLFIYIPSEYEFNVELPKISIPIPKKREEFASYFIENDGHPTESGAKWIAQGIMERLGTQCF